MNMTAMEAKFAREAKERPTDWVIVPHQGMFRLVNLGREKTTTPQPTNGNCLSLKNLV